MKNARQLADELEPFILGERNRCMSEIDGLLNEIRDYLILEATKEAIKDADISIMNQMDLELPEPQIGDIKCTSST